MLLSVLLVLGLFAAPATAVAGQIQVKAPAAWTYLVYLAGDNDLDAYGVLNVNQMQSLPNSKDVNIIVLWDRAGAPDGLYRVVHNDASGTLDFADNQAKLQAIPVPADWYISGTNELATNDPSLLARFVNYAVGAFPAQHYAIDFWDHGGGWRGVAWDDNSYPPDPDPLVERVVNHLTFGDIREALTAGLKGGTIADKAGVSHKLAATGITRLDVTSFDACLLGSVEGSYELRGVTHYFVGSEDDTPGYGYPYHYILSSLIANPAMSGLDFGKATVDGFVRFYDENRNFYGGQTGEQQSVIDEDQIGNLAGAVDGLSRSLLANPSMTVAGPLDASQQFYAHLGQSWLPTVDLLSLAKNLQGTQWGAAARGVIAAFGPAVPYSRYTGTYPDANGLTIFFPNNPNGAQPYSIYREWYVDHTGIPLEFVADTQWDEFLTAFWNQFK